MPRHAAVQPRRASPACLPGATKTDADAKTLRATAGYWQRRLRRSDRESGREAAGGQCDVSRDAARGGTWQAVVGRLDALVEAIRRDAPRPSRQHRSGVQLRIRRAPARGGCGRGVSRCRRSMRMANGLTVHGCAGAAAGRGGHEEVQDDRADASRRAPRSREGRQGRAPRSARASTPAQSRFGSPGYLPLLALPLRRAAAAVVLAVVAAAQPMRARSCGAGRCRSTSASRSSASCCSGSS